MLDGGYDAGYGACSCFWGRSAGSLVKSFIAKQTSVAAMRVLDLGCGEGKNAAAFAKAGCLVTAVDCSAYALHNGRLAFEDNRISWVQCDVRQFLKECSSSFDVVIMYGLLHCLADASEVCGVISDAIAMTADGGFNIVAAFNDGPHDLSAHPGFTPTLLPHSFFERAYNAHQLIENTNAILYETHPHNNIAHHHSLSRLLIRIRHELP